MKRLRFWTILLVLIAGWGVTASAVTKTATANGNWNAAIWNPAGTPTSSDDVVISDGRNVTVNVIASCASLTINGGGASNVFTISPGIALTVSGAVTINAGTGNNDDKTIAVGSGSLSCASITMAATGSDTRQCRVTISTGTVTVSGNIAMNDANPLRNLVSFSGAGSLNIGGNITGGDLVPSTGTVNYNGSAAQTIAVNANYVYSNLHINNAAGATLQGAITTSNVTRNLRVQSGTLSNGGSAIAGNGTRVFEVANGATFRLTGSSSFPTGFGTFTLGSTSTVDYAGTAQTVANRTYSGNLMLSGSGAKTLAGNTTVNGKLSLQGTASFAGGGFTLTLGASASLEYKGNAAQTTGPEFPSTMAAGQTVIVENASGVTLGAAKALNGPLVLTSGTLTLGANDLTIGSTGSISGGSASSYIATNGSGKLLLNNVGTVAAPYPVGTSSSYNPVTIQTGSGTDNFSVRVVNAVSPPSSNDPVLVQRTWVVDEGTPGGNGTVRFTVQWNGSDEGAAFDRSNSSPRRHNGTDWVFDGTFVSISGTDPYVESIDVTGSMTGSWAIANTDAALPVQLTSFTAAMAGGSKVQLNWSTVTETNNYGFEVQKSADRAEGYQTIANSFVPGHGTTLKPEQYTYVDETAQSGVWYYRLKQIDLDGAVHYSDGVKVSVMTSVSDTAPMEFRLTQNYPNPFNPETRITFSVQQTGRATVRVYNSLGQEVATLFDEVAEAGQYHTVKLNGMNLASGVYFYTLDSGSKSELKKMLLLK